MWRSLSHLGLSPAQPGREYAGSVGDRGSRHWRARHRIHGEIWITEDYVGPHGIPEAMEAVLTSKSRIEAKVAILKPISSAIAIGSGGPFGAEGPIIQTGGAFGSLIGQIVSTTATERKVLLACGAGGGLAAMFNAPITGVLLAIELLLFEFRARSFIPLVIANTFAVAARLLLFGDETMFHVGLYDYKFVSGIPFYLILGIICGFAAVGFATALKKLEEAFEHWKQVPLLFRPAVGALGLGIVGYFFPRVFGPGYDSISDILNVRLVLATVVLLLLLKSFVVLISLGSGNLRRHAGADFYDERRDRQYLCDDGRELHISRRAPFRGSLCCRGHGERCSCASARATFTFMVCVRWRRRAISSYAVLPIMLVCVVADAIAVRYLSHIHHDGEVCQARNRSGTRLRDESVKKASGSVT